MNSARVLTLFLFLALVMGGGLTIGYLTRPGEWYLQLAKPSFNPPGWIFGPVWTVLYVMIAVAGWRLWYAAEAGLARVLWWLQLVLNFSWSPAFFAVNQIGAALAIIVVLLITIVSLIALTWRQDRTTALLLVPNAAWVAFATALNTAIFQLN
ncbi:MAG: TspO/MBR family protein [Pseudomonadota bacterium]